MPTVLFLALLVSVGCDQEPVRTYQVPKPHVVDPTAGRFHQAQPIDTPVAEPANLEIYFEAPDDWQPVEPGRMVEIAFKAGAQADAPSVTISSIRMELNVQANVNRWLDQVGRPPVDAQAAAQLLEQTAQPPSESYYALLAGDEQSIAVQMINRSGVWWFIKMQGGRASVEQQLDAFRAFVATVRFLEQGAAD
jgi:hypothetical protein